MTQNIKITKDTQIGFGYTAVESFAKYTSDDRAKEPYYTGPVESIIRKRSADFDYLRLLDSSMLILADWFVDIDGKWTPVEISDVPGFSLYDLYRGYADSIIVTVRE